MWLVSWSIVCGFSSSNNRHLTYRWTSNLKSNAIKILIMKSSIRWKMHIEIKLFLLCGISSACRLRWKVHSITIISLVECNAMHMHVDSNTLIGMTWTGCNLAGSVQSIGRPQKREIGYNNKNEQNPPAMDYDINCLTISSRVTLVFRACSLRSS